MKKIFFTLITSAMLLIPQIARADVIPPNSHSVDRCVTIDNLSKYPDLVFIGVINAVAGSSSAYRIESNKCLTKGYKFNHFSIYWTTKSYFDTQNLSSLAIPKSGTLTDTNYHLITSSIDPYGGTVPDSNPKTSEHLNYQIIGSSSNNNIKLADFTLKVPTVATPTPSNLSLDSLMPALPYILVSLAALSVIIMLVFLRRKKPASNDMP